MAVRVATVATLLAQWNTKLIECFAESLQPRHRDVDFPTKARTHKRERWPDVRFRGEADAGR